MGAKLRAFFDEIGDGDIDIQLSVNPLLDGQQTTHAIGFVHATEEEYYEGDEIETEESE
ncbi:hypothetical protein [Psychrobacillus sp. OK032]|uniref:hypothetical protein n=1 Tax=Psychrobacillus sp. OK032 TaxID=1884358 RepID=UPI0015A5187D|nr:hypothetical protein [Psychrobacillus sp. OK032]